MPIFLLTQELIFPPAETADHDGLLAVGGDLSPKRLLLAYKSGIFPWYDEDCPILWHSPDPRMVLEAENLRVNRSLRKFLRKNPYQLSMDTAFEEVITHCAYVQRPDQSGTWLTPEMIDAYITLHKQGYAHSIEAWKEDQLVGGLYGLSIGKIFFGESMFALAPNASKVAFVSLIQQLKEWDIQLVDCQVHTDYLEHFGAELWPRKRYLQALRQAVRSPTKRGPWQFEPINY